MQPVMAFALVGALGVGSQWLAWRLRMPAIVLMLAGGLGALQTATIATATGVGDGPNQRVVSLCRQIFTGDHIHRLSRHRPSGFGRRFVPRQLL